MSMIVLAGARGASAGGGGSEYSVTDAIAGAPFAITGPTEPTITSSATVSNDSEFNSNRVNGRRLTLSNGSSFGDLSLSTTDQEIIVGTGVTIGSFSTSGAARIKIRGVSARAGSIGSLSINSTSTDIYFYQVTIDASAADELNQIYGTRIAFISCAVTMGDYCIYSEGSTGDLNDLIVGNCNFHSLDIGTNDASVVRIVNATRTMIVDSRLANDSNQPPYRVQCTGGTSDNHCARRNQMEGTTGSLFMNGTGSGLGSMWLEENDIYTAGFIYIGSGPDSEKPQFLSCINNTGYGFSFPTTGQLVAGSTSSGNVENSTTTPPAWSFAA